MTFTLYDASAPLFTASLGDMQAWLDKALAEGRDESTLMAARLAPDMHPLTRQIQIASDTAKGAMARLAEIEAPSMPDTETSFVELKDRCARTIAFVQGVDRLAIDGHEGREVVLKFPNGVGYRFTAQSYLTDFVLPNFYFHATTAYAILRKEGVGLGKQDFLQHLGPPNLAAS